MRAPDRQQRFLALVAIVASVSGCAARTPPAPPPAPAVDPGEGMIVTLTWADPVDLDLYVTDPTWETVYFANNPSRAGGRLERDARCGDEPGAASRVEIARLPPPRDGPYRIGVDFIDDCGTGITTAQFRVAAVMRGGERERAATASTNIFAPIVLELTVRRADDGTPTFATEERAQ